MPDTPEIQRLRINGRIENLERVVSWIGDFCKAHVPAAAFEHHLQIIAEEIIINVISHGYGENREDGPIWLTLYPQPAGAALVIEDQAPPFNPLKESPEPDTNASLEDRPIGGLGVKLMREMADRAAYSYMLRNNRLSLVFGPGALPDITDAGQGKDRLSGPVLKEQPEKTSDPKIFSRYHPGGFTLRVLVLMLLLPVAGLAASGTLNFLKFERVLTAAAAARYDPVLRELENAIGKSLEEGLNLASTRTTEHLIDRSVTQFGGAFDLTVKDSSGAVLFTSLPDLPDLSGAQDSRGQSVADFPAAGEIRHVSDTPDRFTAHIAILQNREPVGLLSLSHDTTAVKADLAGLARQIAGAGLLSALVTLPLLVLTGLLILGRIEGGLHGRKAAIDRAGEPAGEDPGPTDPLVRAVWRIGQDANHPPPAGDQPA